MSNAIPTWVYTFITVALIGAVVYSSFKTSGGIKKPVQLFVLTTVTVCYVFSLTFIKDVKPQLGLDLQGGVSVTLLAKGNPNAKNIDVAVSIIRERVDGLGVAEAEVYPEGKNIIVDLPGLKDAKRAQETVGQTAKLYFREVAENNYNFQSDGIDPQEVLTQIAVTNQDKTKTSNQDKTKTSKSKSDKSTTTPTTSTSVPSSEPQAGKAGKHVTLETTATTIPEATTTTTTTPTTTQTTISTLQVQCGGKNPTTVSLTGDLSTFTTRENDKPENAIIGKDKITGLPKLLCPAVLGGDIVSDSYKSVDSTGKISTAVKLKSKSSKQFTEKIGIPLSDKAVAIVLDGIIVSDPVINPDLANGLSNDTIEISFGSAKNVSDEAENLAQVLKFGALPVELEQQTASKISPTLGTDQLNSGLVAGGIGLLLVILYMFFYYRILSLVVFGGILFSGMTTYALISWLGSTQGLSLTLAGIVGLIISLGVTVDSYVVYFEKLKDEVRYGRSVRSSLDSGFKAAFNHFSCRPNITIWCYNTFLSSSRFSTWIRFFLRCINCIRPNLFCLLHASTCKDIGAKSEANNKPFYRVYCCIRQ